MSLSIEEIRYIAALCRIELTESEVDELSKQLSDILEQFHVLEEMDTSDVEAFSHAIDVESMLRDDGVVPCLDKEDVLLNAPRRESDYFRVNVVIEE